MAQITVEARDGHAFRVTIAEGDSTSTHDVAVPEGYPAELGLADVPEERLVEESFRFLLEREPKESILARFDLPVIARYFPEYPTEIAHRLR